MVKETEEVEETKQVDKTEENKEEEKEDSLTSRQVKGCIVTINSLYTKFQSDIMSSLKENEKDYNNLIFDLKNEIVSLNNKLQKKSDEYDQKSIELQKLHQKFDGIKQLFT